MAQSDASRADVLRSGSENYDLVTSLVNMQQQYPRLGAYPVRGQWGPPNAERQLEFYPPWEGDNPHPGVSTLEVYNRSLRGPALTNALSADMLHLIGAVDPRTGQPVDPKWLAAKQQFLATLTPEQRAMNERAYAQALAQGERRPFDEWMMQSRGDAFLRGGMFGQWPMGVFTSKQLQVLDEMRRMLQRPQ